LVGGENIVGLAAWRHMADGGTVLVEAAQGYALGLHAGWYPKCTSGDCTTIDALAAAQINPWAKVVDVLEPWVVFRTYPIRVAGESGTMAAESSWGDLGLAPERTTVTNKVRRVGRWDPGLARIALQANGGRDTCHTALTMFDYLEPDLAGVTDPLRLEDDMPHSLIALEKGLGTHFELVGTGPAAIIDRRGLVGE